MTKGHGMLGFGIALLCAALSGPGCSKSSSNPVGTGGVTGSFSDLVGFWFSAADTSGVEIRSDSTVHELEVDNTGKLVYRPDSANFSMKIRTASGGTISGTVRVLVAGFVDTTLAFTGTYSFSANKDTLHTSLTGPFGAGGQTSTMSETSVRSSLDAQVMTGGGGGGGGNNTPGTMSFISDKGSFSANGVYNANATSGDGAIAYHDSVGSIKILSVLAYHYNSPTSMDIAIVDFAVQPGSEVGTYAVAQGQVTMRYFVGVDPNGQNAYNNYYGLTSGTAGINTYSASAVQGTFSGSGIYYNNNTPSGGSFTVTNGAFSVPIGTPGAQPVPLAARRAMRIVSRMRR